MYLCGADNNRTSTACDAFSHVVTPIIYHNGYAQTVVVKMWESGDLWLGNMGHPLLSLLVHQLTTKGLRVFSVILIDVLPAFFMKFFID